MKARVLPIDSDEHRFAQEHLPWFVNGTLDASEGSRLAAHLAQCSRCQGDATAQAELRAAAPGNLEAGGDVEQGWVALRRQLEQRSASARPVAATRRWWWRPGLQFVVALQAAVMLVLGVALIGLSYRAEPYRALGAAPVNTEANALAVFRADATEQQMREALRAADARIVGGPTVTDAYLLRLNEPGPDALARLRARPGVARVESLQGKAAR